MNAHASPDYLPAIKRIYEVIPRSHFHVVGEHENEQFTVLTGKLDSIDQADRIANGYICESNCPFLRVHVKKCAGRWCS